MDQCKSLLNSLASITVKSPQGQKEAHWQPKQKRTRKRTRNDPMYAQTNQENSTPNAENDKMKQGMSNEQTQNLSVFCSGHNKQTSQREETKAECLKRSSGATTNSGATVGQYRVKIHSPKLRESKGERSPSELKLQCYKNSTDEAFEEFNNEIYKRVNSKRGKSANVRSSMDQVSSNDVSYEDCPSASSDELLEIPEEAPCEQKTPARGGLKARTRGGLSTASSDRNHQIKFEESAKISINGCHLQIAKLTPKQESVFTRDYFSQFGDVQHIDSETDRFTQLILLTVEYSSENSALSARIDLQRLLLNSENRKQKKTQIEKKLQGYQHVRQSKGIPLHQVEERLDCHLTDEDEEAQAQSDFTFNLLKLKGEVMNEDEEFCQKEYHERKQSLDSQKDRSSRSSKHVPTKLLFGCFSEKSNPLLMEDQEGTQGPEMGEQAQMNIKQREQMNFLFTDESGRYDTQFTVDPSMHPYSTEEAILATQLRLNAEDPEQAPCSLPSGKGEFFPVTPYQQAMVAQAHARMAQAKPFVFTPSNSSNKSEAGRSNGSGHSHRFTTQFKIELERIKERKDLRTTVMIKNIPNKYTEEMLIERITEGLGDKHPYDFFYLPIDAKNLCNVGYAFINFIDQQSILALHKDLDGKSWPRFNSDKVCEITYARVQGRANLVNNFYSKQSSNEKRFKTSATANSNYYSKGGQ